MLFKGVYTARQDLISDGSEVQVCEAATQNARRASSVRVPGAESNRTSDDLTGLTGTVVWIRSLRYAVIEDDSTLNGSDAIL